MIRKIKNKKVFGFFKGMQHDSPQDEIKLCVEDIKEYQNIENVLSKETILNYLKNLPYFLAISKKKAKDIFTKEVINNGDLGIIHDGDFMFPLDFIYYFEKYDVGIPPEYENYLISKGIK